MTILEAYAYILDRQENPDPWYAPAGFKVPTYIQLNFKAVRTDVTFEEVVGQI